MFLEMDTTKGTLSRYEHESMPFLEYHVRGTRDEIVTVPRADGGRSFHATRHNCHAIDLKRPAGDRCRHIVTSVDCIRQRANIGNSI